MKNRAETEANDNMHSDEYKPIGVYAVYQKE